MELHCRYHPTRAPVLMCYQCATTVCPDCIPSWPAKGLPRCITCRAEMEQLGISDYVKPFWQCFDRFFSFPWKKNNLLFLFSALTFFLIFVPLPDPENLVGPLAFIYRLLVWIFYASFIVAYFSAVATKASDGSSEPPEIMKVWKDGGFSLLFKALFIISLFSMALGFLKFAIGPTAGLLLTFVGAIFFPAALMLLFMEREINVAIHPGRIAAVIQAIGWPYVFLWGLVMILISGPEILNSLPAHVFQSNIFPYIFLTVTIYFSLVLFHMLGYVVYQYHFELGVALPHESVESLNKPRTLQKSVIIEAEILIMDGHYESAMKLLEGFLEKYPTHENVQQKLFATALVTANKKSQLIVIENFLSYLISTKQGFKVTSTLKQFLRIHTDLGFDDFVKGEELKEFLQQEKENMLISQLSNQCS